MNAATNSFQPSLQTASSVKPLWAAVGILGVAVLAMGSTLIYQGRSFVPALQIAAAPVVVASQTSKPLTADSPARAFAGTTSALDDMVEKPKLQAVRPAPVHVKKIAKPTPQFAPSPAQAVAGVAPVPALTPAPAAVLVSAPVCGNCGAIESVTAIERTTKADGPGIGAVAGGLAGAVLGSQVGNGKGRTVAAVLGAIGGGYAGNAIEKNMKKETVYQVGVRMEDGSRRTLEVANPPVVGSKVTVEGSTIRTIDGGLYRASAPVAQRSYQSAPTF